MTSSVPDRYAVVDVETTGFDPAAARVVQVAVSLVDTAGEITGTWHSLVDPQTDPGPVHIHGLTAEMLQGAPTFDVIAPHLATLLAGRTLVAHNADFDWGFLAAEFRRAGVDPDITHRLCTLVLARRLDLALANLKLPTLAAWAGVVPERAHDAIDDVRVLTGVFREQLDQARRFRIPLPVQPADITAPERPATTAVPRTEPRHRRPDWVVGKPLVQGLRVVLTGPQRRALGRRAADAGLVPLNTAGGSAQLLVADHPGGLLPQVTEPEFEAMLADVRPGEVLPPPEPPVATGPLAGRRVWVLGGDADTRGHAAETIASAGGRVVVDPGPGTDAVLALGRAELDPRHDLIGLLPSLMWPAPDEIRSSTPAVATRGQEVRLPQRRNLEVVVRHGRAAPPPVLTVAIAVDRRRRSAAAPVEVLSIAGERSTGGEVRLAEPPATAGTAEQVIRLDLEELAGAGRRVLVLATSGEAAVTGPVEVDLLRAGRPWVVGIREVPAAGQVTVLAELYQRPTGWSVQLSGRVLDGSMADAIDRYR